MTEMRGLGRTYWLFSSPSIARVAWFVPCPPTFLLPLKEWVGLLTCYSLRTHARTRAHTLSLVLSSPGLRFYSASFMSSSFPLFVVLWLCMGRTGGGKAVGRLPLGETHDRVREWNRD